MSEVQREAHRRQNRECQACFVPGRICGQGFTEYTCRSCGKTCMHGDTCTPNFCAACSSANGTCRRCGKVLDFLSP